MWELFLDASTARPFILLLKGKEVQLFKEMDGRGSQSLNPALQEIFEKFPLAPKQISKIFVGSGPGSFIGLRSALTIAKMFRVSFETPIVMIPVMQAISLPKEGKIASVVDGKSRGIFVSLHEKRNGNIYLLQEPKLMTVDKARLFLQDSTICSFESQVLEKKLSLPIKQAIWDVEILQKLSEKKKQMCALHY